MSVITDRDGFHPSATTSGAGNPVALRIWLFCVAGLVFAMVLVGGATRLTDSGLSITEWQPILGAIPPLTQADWFEAFEKYKQIPEYQQINRGMSLAAFKTIYWWEWAHRFLGRFIGLAFFVPFVIFWLRGAIPRPLLPRLIALFLLGGAQGALGWYMVQSGLVERTDVSQYRLAAHLGLAVLIYGAILWVAFDLGRAAGPRPDSGSRLLQGFVAGLTGLIFLQTILGGFVAGTDAGLSHNTWPLMDGAIIPAGLGVMQPWYLNLTENVLTIQFNHRMLGYVIALLAAFNLALAWRASRQRGLALAVFAAVLAQIAIGVIAVLSMVPISLGLAHQAGAIVLFSLALYQFHALRRGGDALSHLQRPQGGA